MELDFLSSIIKGDNNPPCGKIVFDSSDHVRFQNGQNVSQRKFLSRNFTNFMNVKTCS